MSDRYKITDQNAPYFITMTIVGWIDIFTRKEQKFIIIDSLKHCQQYKGLVIFGWCLMPSHLHLICAAAANVGMSDILRDFKKFTAKAIIKQIMDGQESRREWILQQFREACSHLKREQDYKVWQDSNQAKIIYSNKFFYEKLNYIHNNPVEDMLVAKPEEYMFSSARNYAGLDYLLEIVVETQRLIVVK
jgi:REP element-mobilizing transposase RayT